MAISVIAETKLWSLARHFARNVSAVNRTASGEPIAHLSEKEGRA
jgi:hypothetical protein